MIIRSLKVKARACAVKYSVGFVPEEAVWWSSWELWHSFTELLQNLLWLNGGGLGCCLQSAVTRKLKRQEKWMILYESIRSLWLMMTSPLWGWVLVLSCRWTSHCAFSKVVWTALIFALVLVSVGLRKSSPSSSCTRCSCDLAVLSGQSLKG